MASETAKSMHRRQRDPLFSRFVMRGAAIDIGAGPDGLSKWQYLWPNLTSVRDWDWEDGDAQLMAGLAPESFDLVHSSHCLEHMQAAPAALERWWELVRPDGYLVVMVPDEIMYEKGLWPPQFNRDHKWSFRAAGESLMPKSLSLADMATALGRDADVIKVERLLGGYDFGAMNILTTPEQDDQTQRGAYPIAEGGIELVVRKRPIQPGRIDALQS